MPVLSVQIVAYYYVIIHFIMYISIVSSGLGLILWIYKQTAPYGGKVSVINADDNAAKLFAVAGLDHLLNLRRRGREKLG